MSMRANCVIQNTKSLEYAKDLSSMGLSASWTSDISKAQRIDQDTANKKVANLNSLIPGRARIVEVGVTEKQILDSADALVELMERFVENPTPELHKELEAAQFAHDVLRNQEIIKCYLK
jgi:hypothetical protein